MMSFVQSRQIVRRYAIATALVTTLCMPGCLRERVSVEELRDALEASVQQGQAVSIENEILEITTSFSIGSSVSEALTELQAFFDSQIPCATVSRPDGVTLAIDFGTLDDACTFQGRTYAGLVSVSIKRNSGSIDLDHVYEGFTDGVTSLDGTVDVAWTSDYRQISSALSVVGARGTTEVTGERTQTYVDADLGLEGGIEVDGTRSWDGPSGVWELDIVGVRWRGIDPVPEAGTYALTTPSEKTLELSFERENDVTIAVSFDAGRGTRTFLVTRTAEITDTGS